MQMCLSEYLSLKKDKDKISYKNRVLQVLVMPELFPIMESMTTNMLTLAIRDVFQCESPIPISSVAI